MAAIARQPFAPLDGARLQNLTSLKNRQNAIASPAPVKRKAADLVDLDDSENVDPVLFSKRSKGTDSFGKDSSKASFVLTKATSIPSFPSKDALSSLTSPVKTTTSFPHPRAILNPRSPAGKLNTNIAKSSPLSAPAGRSPTRGSRRIGILSKTRRRTASPFTRVDPPTFNLSPAPFSLNAALKGTVASYASPRASVSSSVAANPLPDLDESDLKSSWFFDIHEDTPEQEMTNLLQHSTCTLDISSDEESELRARRERAEGRDKENIPPVDDISQTSSRAVRGCVASMEYEKQRDPLGDLNVEEFYAEGCDSSTVIIIPADEEDGLPQQHEEQPPAPLESEPAVPSAVHSAPEPALEQLPVSTSLDADVDALMGCTESPKKAAVLEPMEGTGETFDLWESGSARDEDDGAPTPVPASPCSDTTEILGEC